MNLLFCYDKKWQILTKSWHEMQLVIDQAEKKHGFNFINSYLRLSHMRDTRFRCKKTIEATHMLEMANNNVKAILFSLKEGARGG